MAEENFPLLQFFFSHTSSIGLILLLAMATWIVPHSISSGISLIRIVMKRCELSLPDSAPMSLVAFPSAPPPVSKVEQELRRTSGQ
jgi:hypothetical protein